MRLIIPSPRVLFYPVRSSFVATFVNYARNNVATYDIVRAPFVKENALILHGR